MNAAKQRCSVMWCAATLLLLPAIAHAYTDAVNWSDAEKQAAELLSAYIRIDTSNPPGNEITAARFLAGHFRQAGMAVTVFQPAPGRGAVVARLKGTGDLRPVILLNHLDVVPATPEGWDFPPFSGVVRDGYVYGRGALDCKGVGTIEALAMLLLKRSGVRLKRDVIFLGTGDEETGGKLGAGWLMAEHFDAVQDAEFAINEGGRIAILPNGMRVYEVAVSEKTPCWLRLTATGEAGHGAAPPAETAVTRLVRALERIREYQPPLRVVPEVQAYYAALSPLQSDDRRERYKDLRAALEDENFRQTFLSHPHDAALVRDTITPTVLEASQKINVIPHAASAELDCRLLPGTTFEAFLEKIKTVVDDAAVTIEVLLNFPASASPVDTPLFAAISALAARAGTPVVPSVLSGFTDSHYFREHGIASYGFVPFALTEEEERREHAVNERISTENLREGTRQLVELLQSLDAGAPDARSGRE